MTPRQKPLATQLIFLPLLYLILLFPAVTFADKSADERADKSTAKAVFQFDNMGADQGLLNPYVLKVLQDQQGYIWVATQQGLYRYDGYDFKVFIHDPEDPGSLADNYIQTLYQDSQGVLWVGIWHGGLAQYH
ncbi:MAG: hypothetical protein MJK04_31090, partial [Psychrosphaera sp.]|nr:hypothetical protein [Psychrosphaera sp.]